LFSNVHSTFERTYGAAFVRVIIEVREEEERAESADQACLIYVTHIPLWVTLVTKVKLLFLAWVFHVTNSPWSVIIEILRETK